MESALVRALTVIAACAGCAGRAAHPASPATASFTRAESATLSSESERVQGTSAGPRLIAQVGPGGVPASVPAETHPEYVKIEGWLRVAADDVPGVAAAIRGQTSAMQGRVVVDQVAGHGATWSGTMKLRLPPDQAGTFIDWISQQGEVEERRLQATDVSKEFFDSELALKNLEITRRRLEELGSQPNIAMPEVLAIEKELERVRGEEEAIKGNLRWLQDQVSYATLEIYLHPKAGSVRFAPHAKFHPGPRASVLYLVDAGGREDVRFGGGVTLYFARLLTLDLDLFASAEGDSHAVLTTLGGAAFSDFLGRGRRTFLNPYLGYRLGYGYFPDEGETPGEASSRFVIGGEAGVELFKHKYVMVDANLRALGLIGEQSDLVVQGGLQVLVAF